MTRFKRIKQLSLGVAAASMLVFDTGSASAERFLFDMLFGGEQRQRVVREAPRDSRRNTERTRSAPRVAAPKVSAPSYYDYKVDPLVRVDFAALAEPVTAADAEITNSVESEAAALVTPVMAAPADINPPAAPSEAFLRAVEALEDHELLAEEEVAAALIERYTERPEFIWLAGNAPNARARRAMETLADADRFGMPAAEYAVALPGTNAGEDADPVEAAAVFEMALSARVMRYVRDAHGGRIDPNRISGYHDFKEKPLDLARALDELAEASDVRTALEAWHPDNEAFAALKDELETLKASAEREIAIEPDILIRPGQTNPEFAKVLKVIARDMDDDYGGEFGPLLAAHAGSETYADELVPAIKAAQTARGLNADGIVGPRTVAALVGESKAARIDKVLVAMEQLRWLPEDLGDRHVFINTPAFEATYVEDGEPRLSMRTIVGKAGTQTFFFQDELEYVEFHPYWGIPRSILVNKYLPKLYSNPGYLDQIGYEVTNSRGQRVSSRSINWARYGARPPFDVRQPPGPKNALGEMKIMFPNRHAIYMHDTPEKHLFDRDARAFSNGCVRLKDPRGMAAAVLGWSREQVEERLKKGHGRENITAKIPVYVAYFTAWPNAAGVVEYSGDVYNRDRRMLAAMEKVDESRVPSS